MSLVGLICFVFLFIFANFQDFYNKSLCYVHYEFICSQVGMMALNISVKKFYLYFKRIWWRQTSATHTTVTVRKKREVTTDGNVLHHNKEQKHYM